MTRQIYHPNYKKTDEQVFHNEGYDCGLPSCTEGKGTIENQEYIAYCECGDALERKELYPSKATYHCFGCNKTFKLVEQKRAE